MGIVFQANVICGDGLLEEVVINGALTVYIYLLNFKVPLRYYWYQKLCWYCLCLPNSRSRVQLPKEDASNVWQVNIVHTRHLHERR